MLIYTADQQHVLEAGQSFSLCSRDAIQTALPGTSMLHVSSSFCRNFFAVVMVKVQ